MTSFEDITKCDIFINSFFFNLISEEWRCHKQNDRKFNFTKKHICLQRSISYDTYAIIVEFSLHFYNYHFIAFTCYCFVLTPLFVEVYQK